MISSELSGSANGASIHAARGAIRDALSAVRNLAHLLRSVRVGPRALGDIIPDVHAACAPMIHATERLLASENGVGNVASRAALLGYLRPRMEALENALASARSTTFRASQRLALEKVAARIVPELDGALGLVDFLLEATHDRRVHVDVFEMARESATILEGGHLPRSIVQAELCTSGRAITVDVNARATMALLTLCVSSVAGIETRPVKLSLRVIESQCHLDVAITSSSSATIDFVAPIQWDPTAVCAEALAQAAGIELATVAGAMRLTLPVVR